MLHPKTVLVRIEGRVQGVYFRKWTLETASQLGLNGWVRNRHDGSVEAVFSGVTQIVDQMLSACWQGSPASHVTAVKAELSHEHHEPGFRQLATA